MIEDVQVLPFAHLVMDTGVMQINLFMGLPSNAGPGTVDRYVEGLRSAADAGFRRVWTPQLPYDADLTTVLAVAFREVDGIEVGTGVLPIQIQHPTQMAQRALTLNLISGGRFLLGLGMSHRMVTETMWGIPYDKPVRRLNEYLDGLLPLLDGKAADARGETVTTVAALRIPDVPAPPVYIAALGPQLLKIAGRRSAGTVTWMTGPKTLAEHTGPTLRDAAEEAGRGASAVRVVAALPVSVTDDVDAARKEAATEFAVYGHLPSYRAMLDREGYRGPEDAALIGDEKAVTERVEELREAGVDELVAIVFDSSAEVRDRTTALLRELDQADY